MCLNPCIAGQDRLGVAYFDLDFGLTATVLGD